MRRVGACVLVVPVGDANGGVRNAVALALYDYRRFAQEQQRWLDEQRTRMQQDRLILWQSIVAVHKQRYGRATRMLLRLP